jgi:hypothetical protein
MPVARRETVRLAGEMYGHSERRADGMSASI